MDTSKIYHKENTSSNIHLHWDHLWRQLQISGEPALWDIPPTQGMALDYLIFHPFFNPQLPVVDIGCGSGNQTVFLTQFYNSVIGVDASKKAIALAKKLNKAQGASFELLNLLNKDEVETFYQKCGDVNIYMRGFFTKSLLIIASLLFLTFK